MHCKKSAYPVFVCARFKRTKRKKPHKMARRGDLWACVFKGAVLKYCHKANAETERVPRGQSIESGGHGLKAAAEKSRAKCIRERMR